jgi:hypothetical protein
MLGDFNMHMTRLGADKRRKCFNGSRTDDIPPPTMLIKGEEEKDRSIDHGASILDARIIYFLCIKLTSSYGGDFNIK